MPKLFAVYLGGRAPKCNTELHDVVFVAGEADVKKRAKKDLLPGTQSLHTDDLYDIDDCLEINEVDGCYIHLEPTTETQSFEPNNGYHIIPPLVVANYAKTRRLPRPT
jgi:hypothetical protein